MAQWGPSVLGHATSSLIQATIEFRKANRDLMMRYENRGQGGVKQVFYLEPHSHGKISLKNHKQPKRNN